MGNAYYSLGQHQLAIDFYQQYRETAQEIGDRSGVAKALGNLGNVYSSLKQYQLAIDDYHQQSLVIAQEIGERLDIGKALNNIGSVFLKLRSILEPVTGVPHKAEFPN